MTSQILREVITLESIEEATSESKLGWLHGVEVQKHREAC